MCNADSELALVVREERIGWVVPPHHVNELVTTIRKARSEAALLETLGIRARVAAQAKYTRAHILDAYRALIASLWTK